MSWMFRSLQPRLIALLNDGVAQRQNLFVAGLAYALISPTIMEALHAELNQGIEFLAESTTKQWLKGTPVNPDGVMVLLAYKRTLAGLPPVEFRQVGPALVSRSILRSGRPFGILKEPFSHVLVPFDPAGFHFGKSFLDSEVLGRIRAGEIGLHILCQKYPIFPDHVLLCDRNRGISQRLTQEFFEACSDIAQRGYRKDFMVAYSSLLAGASVNSQHAHIVCIKDMAIPFLSDRFTHWGGDMPYPANFFWFDAESERDRAWTYCSQLQADDEAFNVCWLGKKVVVFPRKKWFATDHPGEGCPAWSELLLVFHATSNEEFETLSWEQLRKMIENTQHLNPPKPS